MGWIEVGGEEIGWRLYSTSKNPESTSPPYQATYTSSPLIYGSYGRQLSQGLPSLTWEEYAADFAYGFAHHFQCYRLSLAHKS